MPFNISLSPILACKFLTSTYENNIGFFAMSKNSEPLIKQMQQKIEDAKQELKALEEKIRLAESEENNG